MSHYRNEMANLRVLDDSKNLGGGSAPSSKGIMGEMAYVLHKNSSEIIPFVPEKTARHSAQCFALLN